jgi:hypothetical protein
VYITPRQTPLFPCRQQRFCARKNPIPVGLKADAQFRFLIGKGLLNLIVFYVPEDLLTCPASPNEETLFGYISIHEK